MQLILDIGDLKTEIRKQLEGGKLSITELKFEHFNPVVTEHIKMHGEAEYRRTTGSKTKYIKVPLDQV